MNLHQIETFLCVCENSSFSKAAEKSFISPSAVLQQIQSLEKELGFSLFFRHSTGVTHTEAGRVLYGYLSKALPEFQTVIQTCKALSDAQNQKLTFAFFQNNLPNITPQLVPHFLSLYPRIDVRYVPTTLKTVLDDVRSDKIDLCEYAFSEEIHQKGLFFHPCAEEPRWCLMDANDPLAQNECIARSDLSGRIVGVHEFAWCPEIVAWCKNQGDIDLREIPCTTQAVYSACLKGGLYLLPKTSLSAYSTLKALPIHPTFKTEYGFVYAKRSPSVTLFLDMLGKGGIFPLSHLQDAL